MRTSPTALIAMAISGFATALPGRSCSAQVLIDEALAALGGSEVIEKLQSITYHAPNIFRSRSLMQSYELTYADVGLATSGSQNISFSFASNELVQRIDRKFTPSDYWVWGSPSLDPFDFSLVVHGGPEGFACFVRGNNQIWLPSDLPSGYTDSALAEYLVLHGQMLSPKLLLEMKSSNETTASSVDVNGIMMPTVYDARLNLTVILNPKTSLPYIVRTLEDHSIFGPSTNDLVFSDYKEIDKIMFPHQVQTVYNSTAHDLNAPLEDFVIQSVTINPEFPAEFFDGIEANKSFGPKSPPKAIAGVSHARITEFGSNMLWSGVTNNSVELISSETPVEGLPQVHWILLEPDSLGVKQWVIEFENEVIVGDAPPQWGTSLIEWVAENLDKPITHIWPSHHHGDHAGGVIHYVEAGAKVIIPEIAVDYWSSLPNASFVTFNDTHPYVHSDGNIQAWFLWEKQATHAADWSYVFITEKCPGPESPVALLEADVWQAGLPAGESDQALMRQWLDQLLRDGVSSNATILPTHGLVSPFEAFTNITAYPYPHRVTTDWRNGAAKC